MYIKSRLRKSLFFSRSFYKNPVVFPLKIDMGSDDFEKNKKNIIYIRRIKRESFGGYCTGLTSENTRIKSIIYRKRIVLRNKEKYIGVGESEVDVNKLYTPEVKCKIIFKNLFEKLEESDLLHFILYSYLKENVKDLDDMLIYNYNIYNKVSKHIEKFEALVLEDSEISESFINEQIINVIENKKKEIKAIELVPYYKWIMKEEINYLLRFDEHKNMFLSYSHKGSGYSIEFKIADEIFIREINVKNQRNKKEAPNEIREENPLLDTLKNNVKQSFNLIRTPDEKIRLSVSLPNWLVHIASLENKEGRVEISGLGRNDFAYFDWDDGEFKISLKPESEQKNSYLSEIKQIFEIINRCDRPVSGEESLAFLYTYIYKKNDMEDVLQSYVYEKSTIEKEHLFSMLPLTSIFYEKVMNEITQLKSILKELDEANSVEEIFKITT